MVKIPPTALSAAPPVRDAKETARYLRPQPRQEVPRRQPAAGADPPGTIAHQLLGHFGHRVITRYEV